MGQLHWDSSHWNHLNCVQINDEYKIELFVFDNTWNHFIVCKQMSFNLFKDKGWLIGSVLWHINTCCLFNANFSLYIY